MEFVFAIGGLALIIAAVFLEIVARGIIRRIASDAHGHVHRHRELLIGRIVFGVWTATMIGLAVGAVWGFELNRDAAILVFAGAMLPIILASGLAMGRSIFDSNSTPESSAATFDRMQAQRNYEAQRDRDRKYGGF